MKNVLKSISLVLSLILISTTSSMAYADSKKSGVKFSNLSDDTVIMVVDDKPITVGDLDENNRIVINDSVYYFTPNEDISENDLITENEFISTKNAEISPM